MNVPRLWAEIFGNMPNADDAAEMAEYSNEPEIRLRAVFERTRRYNPAKPWRYARTMLEQTTTGLEAAGGVTVTAPTPRRNALCDGCGEPFDPDWMTLEGWFAFCRKCVRAARKIGVPGPDTPLNSAFVRTLAEATGGVTQTYSASAVIVRRHYGIEAPA